MTDRRSEFRQRQLERGKTRRSGPEVDDGQDEVRERHLGHGVAWGATLGLALGAGLGVALGNLALGVGIGLAVGTGIGMALGAARGHRDAKSLAGPSQTNSDGGR